MGFAVTTAATTYPVTLEEAKLHLRVDFTDEDDYITSAIAAATGHVENETHRALITQTCTQTWDTFPYCKDEGGFYSIRPYRPPLISVTTLTYIASDGTSTSLTENTDFKKDIRTEPARVYPVYGTTWPATRDEPNAVTLVYTAGYGAASVVPSAIKRAILLLVGHYYRNREHVITGTITADLPMSVTSLLYPFYVANPEGY